MVCAFDTDPVKEALLKPGQARHRAMFIDANSAFASLVRYAA